MERYFTRRAGPPTTEWRGREQHAEDDFLALVRHNAATKLGLEWSPVAKKRRVGKPSLDDLYTRALRDFVATLEEPPETLPQTERPGWWRQGMSLFAGGVPPDAAEADATLELEETEARLPPAITRTAELGGRLRTAAPLARMGPTR